MDFTICLYKYTKKYDQYPLYDGIEETVVDTIRRVVGLKGKQQLVVRRYGDNGRNTLILYNYVLNEQKESFGIVLLTKDRYPQNINEVFATLGKVIYGIAQEGKILYYDSEKQWQIRFGKKKLTHYESLLKKHINLLTSQIGTRDFSFVPFSSDYYQVYQHQLGIYQLSDKTWSITEAIKENNIIVITTEIEEENIRNARSIFIGQEKKIIDKDKQIQELKEKLRKSEEANEKQNNGHSAESFDRQKEIGTKKETPDRIGPNPPVKPVKKKRNKDWGLYAFVGIVSFFILFSLIVPWFIPGLLPKLAVALTGVAVVLLILVIFDVFTDSDNIIFYVCLLAILLSSLMTGYGLIWGFPSKQGDELEEMPTIENVDGPVDTIAYPQTSIIPDNFILIPSGTLKQYKGKERQIDSFYISQYEMTQLDWKKIFPEDTLFYYKINNEYPPNKLKIANDSLPVERRFNQIIQYCIKRSKKEGYDGFYRLEDGKCIFDSNGNGYRLPCVAEWVYAARACSKRRRYISGDKLQEIAWYGGNSKCRPHPVGLMNPNELGIHDMCGNVTELCWPEERFKISIYPGVNIGGDYLSYIQVTEDDVYLVGHESEIGFRLVFIPKGTKNDNIINLTTSYKTENGSKAFKKELTQQERFNQAKKNNDWSSMQKLADEGYSPAYMPLAKHYRNNPKQHGLAKKYALKAKKVGNSGADEILKYLEDLDY